MDKENIILQCALPDQATSIDPIKFDYIKENQLYKCCCKITSHLNGSGFLLKLNHKNNPLQILPVLITNYHVLGKKDISIGKKINLSITDYQNPIELLIDTSRITYLNEKDDVTIIQIKPNDGLDISYFLEIDENIYKEDFSTYYNQKQVYILHYPFGKQPEISFGTIKSISEDTYIIEHKCNTEKGSSGSAICNYLNNKVIGVHRAAKSNNRINLGIFIKHIIEEFYIQKKKSLKNIKDIYNFNSNLKEKKNDTFKFKKTKNVNKKNIINNEYNNNYKIDVDIKKKYNENDAEIIINKKNDNNLNEFKYEKELYILYNEDEIKYELKKLINKNEYIFEVILINGFILGFGFNVLIYFFVTQAIKSIGVGFTFLGLYISYILISICLCLIKALVNSWISFFISLIIKPVLVFLILRDITYNEEKNYIFYLFILFGGLILFYYSIRQIILHFTINMIYALNIGQALSNLISTFCVYNNFIQSYLLIYLFLIIISIFFSIVGFIKNYNFLINIISEDKKKLEQINNEKFKMFPFDNHFWLNTITFINFNFNFTIVPISIFIYNNKILYLIIFIGLDASVRYLLKYKEISSTIFTSIIFIRFIFLCSLLYFINYEGILTLCVIIILGITSGLSTSFGYNLPFNDEQIDLRKKILEYTNLYNGFLILIIFFITILIICLTN